MVPTCVYRCVTIEADTKCEICETRLLTQGFYIFPCRHAFHRDCLLQEVHPLLPDVEKSELEHLVTMVGSQSATADGDDVARSTRNNMKVL